MILSDLIAPMATFGAGCLVCTFVAGVVEGVHRERRIRRANNAADLHEPASRDRVVRFPRDWCEQTYRLNDEQLNPNCDYR